MHINPFDDKDSFDKFSRAGHMDEIKWADGMYPARSNVYDNIGKSGRVLEKEGNLYLLNKDFQLGGKLKQWEEI